MRIHKEGTTIMLVTTLILLVLNVGIYFLHIQWLSILIGLASLIFWYLIVQFFRYPLRVNTAGPLDVVSPADGKVVVIEKVFESEYLNKEVMQVSVFMSPLNVHVNWSPIAGLVTYYKYHAGKYLVAWHPKSSTENERTTSVVKHANGTEVLFRQIAGALANRIVNYLKEGEQLEQGHEAGFIKFGSRVDVFLPLDAEILVKIGDKPVGNKTVLARLK